MSRPTYTAAGFFCPCPRPAHGLEASDSTTRYCGDQGTNCSLLTAMAQSHVYRFYSTTSTNYPNKNTLTLMKSIKKKWIKPAVKDVLIFFECTAYAGAV